MPTSTFSKGSPGWKALHYVQGPPDRTPLEGPGRFHIPLQECLESRFYFEGRSKNHLSAAAAGAV